jgi:hypothetical protein
MRSTFIALAVLVGVVGSAFAQARPQPSMNNQSIKVWVNNCPKTLSPAPVQRNGSTYVPLRAGSSAIGAQVKWSEPQQTATVTYGGRRVAIRASQGLMVNGSLFIPLRLMGESLGCKVTWTAATSTIHITTPASAPKPPGG